MAQSLLVVKQDYIRARLIMQLQNHCPEQCRLPVSVEKSTNQCSVFIQPASLLQSVQPLALIDIVGKILCLKLRKFLFKFIAGLLEITHFWCLFLYLCFSQHQTLIWIRWWLCLGQNYQFLPPFSHKWWKQQI